MKLIIRSLTLVLLSISALIIWLPELGLAEHTTCQCLRVSFLDVGQGDAILIETPDNYQVLVDGGPDGSVLRELGQMIPWFDRTIDLVIATHPDLDHIGGLPDVFDRYEVSAYLATTNVQDTAAAGVLTDAVTTEGTRQLYAEAGQVIQVGQDVYIQVLAPHGDETNWESNNASIILRVVYGDTAVMLSGDAPMSIEEHLVTRYGPQLKSDVLKLGHHGSKTSTHEQFLEAVSPQYAVVSAGADNRYGHPHATVIERVSERNIDISQTSEAGTITFVSDGLTMWPE